MDSRHSEYCRRILYNRTRTRGGHKIQYIAAEAEPEYAPRFPQGEHTVPEGDKSADDTSRDMSKDSSEDTSVDSVEPRSPVRPAVE